MEKINKVNQATPQHSGWTLPKKLAIGAGVALVAFLIGYVPSCVDARSVKEQNARLEQRAKLADLRAHMGMVSYEANRNNYANAAQFSTEFFNGLKEVIDTSKDAQLKQKLEALMARRDEITTNLAQADPAVKEKVSQMYADFFYITAAQPQ